MKYTYNTNTALEKLAFGKATVETTADAAKAVAESAPKLLDRLKTFFSRPETRLGIVQLLAPMAGFVLADFIEDVVTSVKNYRATAMEPVYYKKMFNTHPELMNMDPEIVGKLWASLWHHAPLMAQDPVAAGAFIRQTIQRGQMQDFGGPAPDTYSTLTSINKNLAGDNKGTGGTGAKAALGTHFTKYLMSGYALNNGDPKLKELLSDTFNVNGGPGMEQAAGIAGDYARVTAGLDLKS